MKTKMKLLLISVVLISHGAFAFPKVGSSDSFTTSGIMNGAPFSYVTLIETVDSIDTVSNVMNLKTSWMTTDQSMKSSTKKEKIYEIAARYSVVSQCSIEGAQILNASAMASGREPVKIVEATAEPIDTILGKLQSCKITTEETNGKKWTIWFINQGFGIAKIFVSDLPNVITVLSAYSE